jgi:NADH-quinone oxidoreductase subunit M
MNQVGFPLLSLILWLPAVGALALLALPRTNAELARRVSLAFAVVTFLVSLLLPLNFEPNVMQAAVVGMPPAMQFVEELVWLPGVGAGYSLGLDGISLWLVVLTTFLGPIIVLSTWSSVEKDVRNFQVLLQFLQTAMLGVFLAQDLLLFYVFWEFTLIPMTFLIGIWGGGNRVFAARKFFLYTFAGSVLMLLAIIALHIIHREAIAAVDAVYGGTFSFSRIVADIRAGNLTLDGTVERWLFGAFFLAFAVKVPLWPFHTWLPDAHVEAPTAGSVVLAGVLLKLGGYGMIRFCLTLFPAAAEWAAPAIAILAVIGIIYGGAVAYAQSDMKKLVAYSSVSHMGFVVLGIFALNAEGISGAVIQMVNHGLSTSALFLMVGVLYERRHTRNLADYGGIWKIMPLFGALSLLAVLSSAALPGLNGFIGEFTIITGTFRSETLGWIYIVFAVTGVVLAAAYLLKLFRAVFMGDVQAANSGLRDIDRRETLTLALLSVPMVVIGLFPAPLFNAMQQSISDLVNLVAMGAAGQ